jgi:hypothetical protein
MQTFMEQIASRDSFFFVSSFTLAAFANNVMYIFSPSCFTCMNFCSYLRNQTKIDEITCSLALHSPSSLPLFFALILLEIHSAIFLQIDELILELFDSLTLDTVLLGGDLELGRRRAAIEGHLFFHVLGDGLVGLL